MLTSLLRNKLLWIAVLPPFALLLYIYKMDKKERESPGLLIKIFLRGVIACIPAIISEFAGEYILKMYVDEQDGLYPFIEAYFVVALSEEIFKYIAVRRSTWYSYEFNCRFDGIVYSVFASLGFAAIENVMYVFNYGFRTGVLRAVLAIPGHMMFGVFMGVFYSKSKEFSLCGRKILSAFFAVVSTVIPIMLHGTYDYCIFQETNESLVVFLCFIAVAYTVTFNVIRHYSRNDYYLMKARSRFNS